MPLRIRRAQGSGFRTGQDRTGVSHCVTRTVVCWMDGRSLGGPDLTASVRCVDRVPEHPPRLGMHAPMRLGDGAHECVGDHRGAHWQRADGEPSLDALVEHPGEAHEHQNGEEEQPCETGDETDGVGAKEEADALGWPGRIRCHQEAVPVRVDHYRDGSGLEDDVGPIGQPQQHLCAAQSIIVGKVALRAPRAWPPHRVHVRRADDNATGHGEVGQASDEFGAEFRCLSVKLLALLCADGAVAVFVELFLLISSIVLLSVCW